MSSAQFVSGSGIPTPGLPEPLFGFPYLPNFYAVNTIPSTQIVPTAQNEIVKADLPEPHYLRSKSSTSKYGIFVSGPQGTVYFLFNDTMGCDEKSEPEPNTDPDNVGVNTGICVKSSKHTMVRQQVLGEFCVYVKNKNKDKNFKDVSVGDRFCDRGFRKPDDTVNATVLAIVIKNEPDDDYIHLYAIPSVEITH